MLVYKNYSCMFNSFDLYLKIGSRWKSYFRKTRQIFVVASQKNVLKNKKEMVPSYLAMFVLFSNLPKKILLRKPCSFHRNRGIFFWGYSARIAGSKFYSFHEFYTRKFLPKISEYKITPLNSYFYGKKGEIGFGDLGFLEEFSETNMLKVKKKFGLKLNLSHFSQNWINVNPLK